MGTRVIALWLSINTLLFKKIEKKLELKGPKYKKEMAECWGAINKKYAFELAKNQSKISSKDINKSFSKTFKYPIFNLLKLFLKY